MKKIIGILGVAVFAVAMFLNTNSIKESSSKLNLENLFSMNTANAEVGDCHALTEFYWPNYAANTQQICYDGEEACGFSVSCRYVWLPAEPDLGCQSAMCYIII